MNRIVVGLDGSEAAAAALGWAVRIAERSGAAMLTVHAFQPAERELLPADRYDAVHDEAARRLEGWSAPARDAVAKLRTEVRGGHPAQVLLEVAEDERADLVVVGTRGAGGFAGLHLGSVAHHLAHHATTPVAIVPLDGAERPIESLLLGVDGSPGSMAAIRWCVDLAQALTARVIAVQAFEPFAEWVPGSDREGWRRYATEQVHRATAPLRDAGIDVKIVVVRDVNPVAALQTEAERHGAGLVIVGARGLGGFPRLRLGRVPIQLVHEARLPVVMVPLETEAEV